MSGKPSFFEAPTHTLFLDQYGNRFFANCLKDLKEQIGKRNAEPMYIDKKDGSTVQLGYVIGNHWLTAYRLIELPA